MAIQPSLDLVDIEAGYTANVRQLKTLLEAQARLREVAEQTAAETRQELERLAQALAPDLVDELGRGEPLGLGQVTARALANAVARDVQRRLGRLNVAEVAGQSVGELYDDAAAELVCLREENGRLVAELATARRVKEQAELRVAVLAETLEDAQRRLGAPGQPAGENALSTPAASAVPGIAVTQAALPLKAAALPAVGQLPEWIQEWQRQQTHEQDRTLLAVLAETGVPRRKDAAALYAGRTGKNPTDGSIHRLFQRCARLELIELIEAPGVVSGGAVHHLVRLTEKGRDACRLLLGEEPVPSQTTELLARHKSAKHALLNLEAGDLLRAAGYQVDLFPGPAGLPEGRLFAPDIAASRDGQMIFVEVERDTRKSLDDRERKWRNYFDATGGQFYVVVPDKAALDAIKGEILFWAGQRPLTLWMTSVSDARGKQGDAVWLFKRGDPRRSHAGGAGGE